MPSIIAKNISLEYPVFVDLPRAHDKELSATSSVSSRIESVLGRKKKFIKALSDISFELGPGDRLGLIGRNGSGKSTLLRILGGVYQPNNGLLEIDGKIASLFNVGLGVRKEATGRRNILLRGLMNGLSHSEAVAKIPEIIEFSELGEFIDLPVRTYSTGMAMRLTFATATAFEPEILLLDEWIGAGDQKFQKKAKKRMFDLLEHAGITVIASHRNQLIRDVCTKCLWLNNGVIEKLGPVDEVLDSFIASERKS